ncbi:MAG: phosphatase PAP2 family protein [Pseudomonadota bacterium]
MFAFTSRVFTEGLQTAAAIPVAERAIPGRWIAAGLIASIFAVALLMRAAGLTIDPVDPNTLIYASVFAALGAVRWVFRNPRSNGTRIVRDVAEYFGVFTALSVTGALASYPIASFTQGFSDQALHGIDLALNFNWLGWYELVATTPALQTLGRIAYAMIYVSPAILLGYLAVTDQRREALDFVAAMWLAAAITLTCYLFMPAVGPLSYLVKGPLPYLPTSDLWQANLIPALRAHLAPVVDLGHLVGLVSAPSFHTAAAVLLISFGLRQRHIGVPLLLINLAMLWSTVVEGTHYLSDMILGALVALVAVGVVRLVRVGLARWVPVKAPSLKPFKTTAESHRVS